MAKRGRKPKQLKPVASQRETRDRWQPPPHLSAVAAWAWSHLVARLEAAGRLDETDPVVVEAYAVNVAMLREAQVAINRDGVVVENGNGTPMAHPACAVVNAATMRLKSLLDGIGKVAVGEVQTESKWGSVFGSAG
jgi:P27 family predicted phage terminase small subunit